MLKRIQAAIKAFMAPPESQAPATPHIDSPTDYHAQQANLVMLALYGIRRGWLRLWHWLQRRHR